MRHRNTGEKTCKDRDRDWSYASTAMKPPEGERGRDKLSPRNFSGSVALSTP